MLSVTPFSKAKSTYYELMKFYVYRIYEGKYPESRALSISPGETTSTYFTP
jgi:hypothetical protein